MRRQGDVYAKIIEDVVDMSKGDFDDNGVGQGTLSELQQVSAFPSLAGQAPLSGRYAFSSLQSSSS